MTCDLRHPMGPIAHAFTLLHSLPRTHTTVICTPQKRHADQCILCAFKSLLFPHSLLCVCVQGVCECVYTCMMYVCATAPVSGKVKVTSHTDQI